MNTIRRSHRYEILRQGVFAGVAGGLAEILWVAFYGALTGNDTSEVARSITTVVGAIFPDTSMITAPAAFGVAFHMVLAIGLGIGLILVWHALSTRRITAMDEDTFMLAALAIVWAFNFFLVLPLIDPNIAELHRSFTEIVPYPVSLVSKLLFGLAAAAVLKHYARGQPLLVRS